MVLEPAILWLIAGAILCLMELFVPTAFVEFMMGLSAFIVAGIALVVPQFSLQVVLWIALSVSFVALSRRFLPNRNVASIEAAKEGETLTEILPGQVGRILYEGNSWRARCEDHHLLIAAKQKVLVIGREGNTLIVVPEHLLHS